MHDDAQDLIMHNDAQDEAQDEAQERVHAGRSASDPEVATACRSQSTADSARTTL